jgi:4-amino-4-deoxy-L-arabinose transferase-like glycosyltransferase
MREWAEAKRERSYWIFTFLLASMPLLGWWLYGLFDVDEGFYAAVSGEMLRLGDWVTPYFNGRPWFEKPILLYWLAAPSIAAFGESIGPRLPSVLASLALYGLVGSAATRRLGAAAGRWAVAILATSPLMAILARMMMFDALFVLFLSASFFALYRSFGEGWKWRLLSGVALGVAILAKGPVALVFWIALTALTTWRQPTIRASVLDFGANAAAMAGMLAAISLWYVPTYLANPNDFVREFLIEQNIGRFAGGDKAHAVPWYLHPIYFPVILGVGMIPWSWRIFEAWPKKIETGEPRSGFLQFCAHWLLVVLVFFTISGSKLPHYILPALVPGAVLLARTMPQAFFGLGTVAWSILLAIGINFAGIRYYASSGQKELHELSVWLRAQEGEVAVYQMGRRRSDRGSGSLQIQETSKPSIAFYLDRNYLESESLDELAARGKAVWILTRKGRIGPLEKLHMAKSGHRLTPGAPAIEQTQYEVYRLEP